MLETHPLYTIKVNPRAKNVLLRVSSRRGLEIVIPTGFDHASIPGILERRRSWLDRAFARFMPMAAPALPDRVEFRAVEQAYDLDLLHKPGRPAGLTPNGGRLVLCGDTANYADCAASLRSFARSTAERSLVPWLRTLSSEIGLPFDKAQIRLQRSRWASCSAKKTISLNLKLLFLPPELTRYIFIHELCHLRHLDHSRAYWNLVASFEPGYKALDRAMRGAGEYVPDWVEP